MRRKLAILPVIIFVAGLLAATRGEPASERRPDADVEGNAEAGRLRRETAQRSPSGVSRHCPGTAKLLMGISSFTSLAGTVGCVTPQAEAFLVLYRNRDLDGFRALARASAAGAQLYALCGLKHLRAEKEAKELRRELSASRRVAAISLGGSMRAVSDLVMGKNGEQSSDFDIACDYLVEKGMQSHRSPCDTEGARPKCE